MLNNLTAKFGLICLISFASCGNSFATLYLKSPVNSTTSNDYCINLDVRNLGQATDNAIKMHGQGDVSGQHISREGTVYKNDNTNTQALCLGLDVSKYNVKNFELYVESVNGKAVSNCSIKHALINSGTTETIKITGKGGEFSCQVD